MKTISTTLLLVLLHLLGAEAQTAPTPYQDKGEMVHVHLIPSERPVAYPREAIRHHAEGLPKELAIEGEVQTHQCYLQEAGERLSATNTIHSEGRALYLAGRGIVLAPGFKTERGAILRVMVASPGEAKGASMGNPYDTDGGEALVAHAPQKGRPAQPDLQISPNPTKGRVSLSYAFEEGHVYTVTIYDLLGRPIQQQQVSGKERTVEMGGLQQGVYLLQMADLSGGRVLTRKVVVQE